MSALLVFLFSVIILIGIYLGMSFEAEHLGMQPLLTGTSLSAGHMSPITAITFLATTAGILFLLLSSQEENDSNKLLLLFRWL